MAFTENLKINAQAPFDFDLTAQIFSGGDKQVRFYGGGHFFQVLNIDGSLVLANVSSIGTVTQPRLNVELKSNSTLTARQVQKAQEIINFIFNLNFPLASFYKEIKNDPVMSQIASRLYGLKNPTTQTVFESLVDSIVEQQISIKVAISLEHRIAKAFGEKLTIDETEHYAFPTPQNIAKASVQEVRDCGLSQRKAEYIHGAAKLIAEGKLDLEGMKCNGSPEKIIAELDEIRGIGVWTAELTMLRGMQRLDALPADDLGIRRVISRYYRNSQLITADQAREIAAAWGRWKGLAAFYLIIAEAKDLTV
jgi:DNA-3-methyladenine glycosylase II